MRDRGTEVWPHLIVASQGRRWTKTRFLLRYGNDEDMPLDPAWVLRAGAGRTDGRLDHRRRRALAPGPRPEQLGAHRAGASGCSGCPASPTWAGSDRTAPTRSRRWSATTSVSAPRAALHLKTFLEAGHGENLRGDQAWVLGLDRGLRTLDLDGMAGDRLLRWSTELGRTCRSWSRTSCSSAGARSTTAAWPPGPDEDRDLADARHEIGAGLRFGSTRSGTSDVARFDLTYDLTGRAGLVLTTVSRGFF
jgi:hypothetical protein